MREIEILVQVLESKETALSKLQRFKHEGKIEITDTYYYDPKRRESFVAADNTFKSMLRTRRKGDKAFITYKEDHFENGSWLYANEWETAIGDANTMQTILENLGYKQLVVVENIREVFLAGTYEIVLEDVKNLGLFLEVEALKPGADAHEERKTIFSLLDSLGIAISRETGAGKAEQLYAKNIKQR